MWGNRLGWTISLLILLVTAGMVVLIVRGPGRTAPTAFSSDPAHFQPLEFDLSPDLPARKASTRPWKCEVVTAGEIDTRYRDAIARVREDRTLYEDFAAVGTPASTRTKRLAAIGLLMRDDALKRRPIFADDPIEVTNYDHTKPPLEALDVLGRVLLDRLALLNLRAGNLDEAEKQAQAAFLLGMYLCHERVCYAEFEIGLQVLGKSSHLLAQIEEQAGESERAAAWRSADQQRVQFVRHRVEPVLRVVRSIDPDVVARHAGDMFELARRSSERMWRVEAILALGRLRFFAGGGATASDQREATRLVTELAEQDPDPIVRAAAIAARDLTPEKHRMQ